MFEQTIDKIKALSALIERQAKAESTKQVVSDLAAQKDWKDIARSFAHKVKNKKEASVQVNLSLYKKASVYKHTTLGSNRLVQSDYALQYRSGSDIRNGRRWIDLLPLQSHRSLEQIFKFYLTPTGSQANIVAEGDPKPVRERTQNIRTFNLQKVAVTDLVTQEALYALDSDRFGEYILNTLLEHVYDTLEQLVANDIFTNSAVFSAASYAGFSFRSAGANWHDLLSAMQSEYKYQFNDINFGVDYGNLLVTTRQVKYAILNDRHEANYGYLSNRHDVNSFLLDDNMVWWSDAFTGTNRAFMINTNAFELHMLDAAEVYFERVAESASERNLYRMVAEVYYALVPRLFGELSNTYPGLRSNDILGDRNAI